MNEIDLGSHIRINAAKPGHTDSISQRYDGQTGTLVRLRAISAHITFAQVRVGGILILVDAANLEPLEASA